MSQNAKNKIVEQVKESLDRSHTNNYDVYRFGDKNNGYIRRLKEFIKRGVLSDRIHKNEAKNALEKTFNIINEYGSYIEESYSILEDDYSKNMFVKLIAYRILGHRRVKLPTNKDSYWETIRKIEKTGKGKKKTDFKDWRLQWFDLSRMGIEAKVLSRPQNIAHQFFVEQYRYKDIVNVGRGDNVIDGGACWGDTSLYFANRVGEGGNVYAFEFVPGNVEIINKNLSMNRNLGKRIELEKKALWNYDKKELYFIDKGPASKVSNSKIQEYEGNSETTTIDSFVYDKEKKLDLIKLDIEGAEKKALKGAEETIKEDSPDLAICSYHSMEDFVKIPVLVKSINGNYKLYLDHATIHWEETVVFASKKEK